jgi:hypothetical protein
MTGCNPWWQWAWGCSDNSYYSSPYSSGSYNLYVPAAAAADTLLYLKDGTAYDVDDYWLADGQVHYKTVDGAEGLFDVDQLDMQRTVDTNADRGVTFTLSPAPANTNAPAPADTLLYLKDGTVYDASDYWLADGQVHYKAVDGAEGSFGVDQLDLERTVNVNANRGVTFVLQPAPAPEVSPDAAPPTDTSPETTQPPDSAAPPPSDQ